MTVKNVLDIYRLETEKPRKEHYFHYFPGEYLGTPLPYNSYFVVIAVIVTFVTHFLHLAKSQQSTKSDMMLTNFVSLCLCF